MYMRVELIDANNMADIEEELLLQANLFLLLVLKRRQRQPQNRGKHRFWIRKIFMNLATASAADKLNFSSIFLPTIILFAFVFEILAISVVNALTPRNFLHKLLVSNVTMFHASHVVNKCSHIRALRLRSVESWVIIKNIMGYVSIANRRTLVSI